MKNVSLSIVSVFALLTLASCQGIDFPKDIDHCTVLDNSRCICTDSFGEETILPCQGFDAFSNEDYDKMQQWGMDQARKLKQCELGNH